MVFVIRLASDGEGGAFDHNPNMCWTGLSGRIVGSDSAKLQFGQKIFEFVELNEFSI